MAQRALVTSADSDQVSIPTLRSGGSDRTQSRYSRFEWPSCKLPGRKAGVGRGAGREAVSVCLGLRSHTPLCDGVTTVLPPGLATPADVGDRAEGDQVGDRSRRSYRRRSVYRTSSTSQDSKLSCDNGIRQVKT